MKIRSINVSSFKRFTNLTITDLPSTLKAVVVVGPNGSGKSSLFDAILHWYRFRYKITVLNNELNYYAKKGEELPNSIHNAVNINVHENFDLSHGEHWRGKFYFRSAYRNDPDFMISSLQRLANPTDSFGFTNFIQNDATVQKNYQRLVSLTLKGLYSQENNHLTVEELREQLIGDVRDSLSRVFTDLNLSNIGDPLENGTFYFEKGASKDFHYKNLSGGEKSAFDLILDLIIKKEYYPDAVMCIDEPETHMHTALQSALFQELVNLTPDNGQLWINTHSIGMLQKARDLNKEKPGTIAILNFDGHNFDEEVVITPSTVDRTLWQKFIELTLGDMSDLVAPKTVVFCEGDQRGRKYKHFDATIYNIIFRSKYPETEFISLGSTSELENQDNITINIVDKIMKGSNIIKLVDRDARTTEEIQDLNDNGIKVLPRRNLESYLLDDEVLVELASSLEVSHLIDQILRIKRRAIELSIERGNPSDDLKSASGEIFVSIKRIVDGNRLGSTKDAFFRDIITPLITPQMQLYKELEAVIFE